MKILLILFIAAAAVGAGYEYHQHQVESADYIQQRSHLAARIVELDEQNRHLADDETSFTAKLNDLQKQAAALKAQVDAGGTNAAPTPAP